MSVILKDISVEKRKNNDYLNNKTELRYTKACKVLESLHDQHKIASQLQSNDNNAYRSEARKET